VVEVPRELLVPRLFEPLVLRVAVPSLFVLLREVLVEVASVERPVLPVLRLVLELRVAVPV
jgi:hypothetical protein